MHSFQLKPKSEYIQLDQLLKIMDWVSSGGEAHAVIVEGYVELNGAVCTVKRKKLFVGDEVAFNGEVVKIGA